MAVTSVGGAERPLSVDEVPAGRWGRLRGYLFDHFFTKAFSLFFAVVVWFYVNTRSQIVEELVVPVDYRGKSESLAFVGNPPDEVELRIRGREAALRVFDAASAAVVIDLSSARVGETVFNLGPNNFRLPADVEIGRIFPRTLNIRLEPVITKQVAVVPDVIGRPADGVRVKRVVLRPSRVTVRGPRSLLDGLERLRTLPLDLGGVRHTFSKKIGLDLIGGRLAIADGDSDVTVTVVTARSP